MSKNFFVKREFCPACKSGDFRTIYSCGFSESPIKEYLKSFYSSQGVIEFEYLEGSNFILDKCSDCGLIFQEEIPNDFLMERLYEKWIDPHFWAKKERSHSFDYLARYAQEIMMILMYFNTTPSKLAFLDFGMGWGNWCQMAKAWGCDAYGFEISKSRIEYAKSQGIKVISLDEIPNHSFDFINTEQVFEHISEPLETLRFLKKFLKTKGIIRISVPDGGDIARRLKILDWTAPKGSRNSLNIVSPLEHINCFNHDSIIKMSEIAGYEQVKIPLNVMYASSTNWIDPKRALKNILAPLYEKLFSKGTVLFFQKKHTGSYL